eukprot:3641767-Rhodomonas_salina.1
MAQMQNPTRVPAGYPAQCFETGAFQQNKPCDHKPLANAKTLKVDDAQQRLCAYMPASHISRQFY